MTRTAVPAAFGSVVLLVLATLLVRQDVPAPEPGAAEPAGGSERCTDGFSAAALPDRTFALSGTVLDVFSSDGDANMLLEVDEWYRGPPVAQVVVIVPDEVVATMAERNGGDLLSAGDQLLVSGDRWSSEDAEAFALAWGCGWTIYADPVAVAEWSGALEEPPAPAPDPRLVHARYPAVGYLTAWATLRGVLVHDGGCLYVQDSRQRWLPVFPADDRTRWDGDALTLEHGGVPRPVGTLVWLGGAAAGPGPDSRWGFAVPRGCDPDVPRWVVGEPSGPDSIREHDVPPDAPFVRTAGDSLARAGLDADFVTGGGVEDEYGLLTAAALFRVDGTDVVVRIETPPPGVGVRTYEPRAGDMTVADVGGVEVGLVRSRDAGYLQAVVRLPSGSFKTVTTRTLAPGDPMADGRALIEAAAAMARP